MFWCLALVTIMQDSKLTSVETAVLGTATKIEGEWITLDITEYAKKQGYIAPYILLINRDNCVNK